MTNGSEILHSDSKLKSSSKAGRRATIKLDHEPIPTRAKSGSKCASKANLNIRAPSRRSFRGSFAVSSKFITKERRTRIPDKPNLTLSLWSVVKNSVGKDLSRISLPVHFSEPLSMLQRLTEDYEYSSILDIAKKCSDPFKQLAYVAAFTISAYSTTGSRMTKPFIPLLGETYECDRTDDLGWKSIAEQVGHLPFLSALFCEGIGWRCWQEYGSTSKFRPKYLEVTPIGKCYLQFDSGNKYTWKKVTTTVHNIAFGKMWVDQHGDVDIVGKDRMAGVKCHLKYYPYSYFSKDFQRRVKGVVLDPDGMVKWTINGTWDNQVEISEVTAPSANAGSVSFIYQTGPAIVAWKCQLPPPGSENYYGFTLLAVQLNEPEDGVAPTDSRRRPDQRLMEEGNWDAANIEKTRLEEKERAREKLRLKGGKCVWFEAVKDEDEPDALTYVYKGEYWKCKKKNQWDNCEDLFS